MSKIKQLNSDISPADGDVATFDAITGLWIPATPTPSGSLTDLYSSSIVPSIHDAVYLSGSNQVALADANDPTAQPLLGLVRAVPPTTPAGLYEIQYYGKMGGFVGLTIGATYFLDIVAGGITDDVTGHGTGCIIQRVGIAISATELVLMIDQDYTEIP